MRFFATAKAAARGNLPQQSRRIREKRERAGQESNGQEARRPQGSLRDISGGELAHGGYSVERPEKNRWSSTLENLVTRVLEPSGKAHSDEKNKRLPILGVKRVPN
jgi:hypothetical protein